MKKYETIYRAEDFSKIIKVEGDDPFDVPDVIDDPETGLPTMYRVPNCTGNGWQYRRYECEKTKEIIEENVEVNDMPDEFKRNGKVYKKVIECIQLPSCATGLVMGDSKKETKRRINEFNGVLDKLTARKAFKYKKKHFNKTRLSA